MTEIITDKDGKITDWGDQKPKSCENCGDIACTYHGYDGDIPNVLLCWKPETPKNEQKE